MEFKKTVPKNSNLVYLEDEKGGWSEWVITIKSILPRSFPFLLFDPDFAHGIHY